FFAVGDRLPHKRADIASRIEGNGKLQADRAAGRVRGVVVDRRRGADARRTAASAPDDVQGGQMPGARSLDLAHGNFERRFLRAYRIALAGGGGGPVFHRVRLGRVELDVRLQRRSEERRVGKEASAGWARDVATGM